jgi:hypothetical protein
MKNQIKTNYKLANPPASGSKINIRIRKAICIVAILCFCGLVFSLSKESLKLADYHIVFASKAEVDQAYKDKNIKNTTFNKTIVPDLSLAVTDDKSGNNSSKASRLYLVIVLIGFSTIILSSVLV